MTDTTIQYLARDPLFQTEKPYRAEFDIEETSNIKSTNHIFAAHAVKVGSVKDHKKFELHKHGFCILEATTTLDVQAALDDPDTVEASYLQQVEGILMQKFPEYKRLEPLEFVVGSCLNAEVDSANRNALLDPQTR